MEISRKAVIAAVQLPSFVEGDSNRARRESNFQNAEKWLSTAAERGADITCLGEHFNAIGQELDDHNFHQELEGVVEETLERLGAIARRFRMHIIAPIWGIVDGYPGNAALILDRDGSLNGIYRKVHPTQMERDLGIIPGNAWPVFDLDFGRVGVQICHDNSFPESARCLTLNGAEIIFWPHVMSGWGGEFMDVLLRSPAIYNGIYHVPVCFGCRPGTSWRPGMLIGRSSVIGPDGTICADAGRYPGIALAWIDLDAPRIAHDFTRAGDYAWQAEMLGERRPELYGRIAQPTDKRKWEV